jgi:hypothetical protein
LLATLAFRWVLPQTAIDKVDKVAASLRQFWWVAVDDALHGEVVFHAQERRLSLYQFDRHHAERPNVHALVVWLLLDKFRYFYFSLQRYEDIIAFEVTVELSARMQAFKSFKHVLEDVCYDVFWDLAKIVVDEIDHGSAVHELNEHEERLFVVVGEIVLGEVVGIAEVHHCDLRPNLV